MLATHSALQRDQNEFEPAPKTLGWMGRGKRGVPGNTKRSKLPPDGPCSPSRGMLRALGTAEALSPCRPPESPMAMVMMVMGMTQVQVPHHESDGRGETSLRSCSPRSHGGRLFIDC